MPKIVDWYMEGKINIDDLITHTLPLERINDGFDLMHAASRSAASSCIDPACSCFAVGASRGQPSSGAP